MKTLNDVINAVQHETQLSRSQLSLKIGKSRNYLNTTVKNGLSYEKEQEVIALLLDIVDDEVEMLRNILAVKEEIIEDYKNKLKEVIDEKIDAIADKNKEIKIKNLALSRNIEVNENLHNKIGELEKDLATKNLFIDGLDMENNGLMDRISKLEKNLNKMCEVNKVFTDIHNKQESELQGQIDCNKAMSEANEGLSSKISELKKDISVTLDNEKSLQKTIESLSKAGHATGKQLNKEITKNRILTASIIGLVAIFSVYLWLK